MDEMDKTLVKLLATPRARWVLAVLFVVWTFVLFPLSPPKGKPTLDRQKLGYSSQKAHDILSSYEDSELRGYALKELTLDMAYPVIYSLLFWSLLALGLGNNTGRWLRFLPFAAGLADVCENVSIVLMTRRLEAWSPGLAQVANFFTLAKWFLVFASLLVGGLLLLIWCLLHLAAIQRGLKRAVELTGLLLQYFYFVRVSLLSAVALLALAVLGSKSNPTITNMMIVDTTTGLGVAAFFALLVGMLCGFTGILAWDLAPERFGVREIKLPALLGRRDVVRAMPFALLGLPLIMRFVKSSVTPPNGILSGGEVAWALVAGAGIVAVLVALTEVLRRKVLLAWLMPLLDRRRLNVFEYFAKLAGHGYYDPVARRVQPGHALVLSATVVTALVYAWGYLRLRPDSAHAIPTLAYVLALIFLLNLLLAGMTFFFDRFRVPLLLVLVLYAMGLNALNPRDHFFEIARQPQERPAEVGTTVSKRLEVQKKFLGETPPVLTVVVASGGGIQAAAWTAQVLTGLQQTLGEDFTRSIHLISSVSGGSVGTYFFLEGFDRELSSPPRHGLDAIRQAAMGSSLEATAWGLVYPDFLRTFFPLPIDPRFDRAWATEKAWLRHAREMKQSILDGGEADLAFDGPSRLSDWMSEARDGRLPGVVFNATIVDDGQQFLATNLDLSFLEEDPPPPRASRVADPALKIHYPGITIDMEAATAARLSATFAYVTPVARARFEGADGEQPPGYHVADGGYFDNFGVVAATQWLRYVLSNHQGEFSQILLIEIRAFPPSEPKAPARGGGLAHSFLGPVTTILQVRNSTQVVRNELELSLFESLMHENVPIKRVAFRPPLRKDRRDPPLSWYLSRQDKAWVCHDWLVQKEQVESLKKYFPSSTDQWPSDEDCEEQTEDRGRVPPP